MLAEALGGAALRDGDRAFERIDNIRRADVLGASRQPITAVCAARRDDQSRARQRFEQFADGWQSNPRLARDLCGAANAWRIGRQVRKHHGAVICQFADSEQGFIPLLINSGLF